MTDARVVMGARVVIGGAGRDGGADMTEAQVVAEART
jgi:hypothetical protein